MCCAVYPEGENDTDKDFIGAYMELMSQANRDVKSMFEIGMADFMNREKRRQFLLRKTDPVDWFRPGSVTLLLTAGRVAF